MTRVRGAPIASEYTVSQRVPRQRRDAPPIVLTDRTAPREPALPDEQSDDHRRDINHKSDSKDTYPQHRNEQLRDTHRRRLQRKSVL